MTTTRSDSALRGCEEIERVNRGLQGVLRRPLPLPPCRPPPRRRRLLRKHLGRWGGGRQTDPELTRKSAKRGQLCRAGSDSPKVWCGERVRRLSCGPILRARTKPASSPTERCSRERPAFGYNGQRLEPCRARRRTSVRDPYRVSRRGRG